MWRAVRAWRSSLSVSTSQDNLSEGGRVPAGGSAASRSARIGAWFGRFFDGVTRVVEKPRFELIFFGAIFLLLLAFTTWRPLYPNYDTYYALIWGSEIFSGELPFYEVFKTPTPHPLFNIYAGFFGLFGGATIKLILIASLAMYVGLLWGVFRLVKLQLGSLVGFVAVLVLLMRTDLMAFAFRSMLDIPFLLLIVWAAVLEVQKPRRGLAPLLMLTAAGLLRPEAWLMAGIYWLWLVLGHVRPKLDLPGQLPSIARLFWYALLVGSAPIIWAVSDYAVTGDFLYSFNSTSEVAEQVRRQKSLLGAIAALPGYVGGSEKIVNFWAGGAGFLLAFWAYRARMFMLAALAAVGVLTYLLIAIGGLSVISRYLVLPSIVLCIGVAFSLVGWAKLEGTARKIGIVLAILTVLLGIVRAPAYVNNFRALNTSTDDVSVKYSRVYDILENPKVRENVERCLPVVAFTHETVPIIRLLLDLPRQQVTPTTALDAAPTEGTQMLQTSALDPLQMTVVDRVLRKEWTGFHQPGFAFQGENRAWIVYTSCDTEDGS